MQQELAVGVDEDMECSMDFSGMTIEEIEGRMEMAHGTALDHMLIANECRAALCRRMAA